MDRLTCSVGLVCAAVPAGAPGGAGARSSQLSEGSVAAVHILPGPRGGSGQSPSLVHNILFKAGSNSGEISVSPKLGSCRAPSPCLGKTEEKPRALGLRVTFRTKGRDQRSSESSGVL